MTQYITMNYYPRIDGGLVEIHNNGKGIYLEISADVFVKRLVSRGHIANTGGFLYFLDDETVTVATSLQDAVPAFAEKAPIQMKAAVVALINELTGNWSVRDIDFNFHIITG